jgi:hypothetical protein
MYSISFEFMVLTSIGLHYVRHTVETRSVTPRVTMPKKPSSSLS